MTGQIFSGLELWPESMQAKQLFILLHGLGANSSDLALLAEKLKDAFPTAGFFLPDATFPFDGTGSGRQWYSNVGINEISRAARVAEAMPAVLALVKYAQKRFNVLQSDTALAGFSQGAIMSLEFAALHDGEVGRVLAFSGRFATLPQKAPTLTTVHLLHGDADPVISAEHAFAANKRLTQLEGDVTLDVAAGLGHELHPAIVERAIYRLKTTIPLRSWKQAMKSV